MSDAGLRIVLDVAPAPSGDGSCRGRCPELDVEVSGPDAGETLLSLARAVVHCVELEAARTVRDGSSLTEALRRRLDEAELVATSPVVLHDLLGRRTIDGLAHVEIEEGAEGEDAGDEEGDLLGEVFLIRVDGTWHALWAATSVARPAIYCAREGSPTWHLVPEAPFCATICAAPESACPPLSCDLVSASSGCPPPLGQEEGRVTRVVDAGTGEVLLEIGLEWYAYQCHLSLPLALVAPSARRVPPGESVVVAGQPSEGSFDVRRLVLGRDADHWVVEDVLVGGSSQLEVGHGELPGALFLPTATVGLCIGLIDPAHPLSVRARYVGPDPSGGELQCTAWLESSEEVTRHACHAVVGGSWYQDLDEDDDEDEDDHGDQ